MKNHVSRGIRSGEVRAFKILKRHRGFANWKEGALGAGVGGHRILDVLQKLAPILLGFGVSILLSCSGFPCSSTSQPPSPAHIDTFAPPGAMLTTQNLSKLNFKPFSPLSDSDRGEILLKISFSHCGWVWPCRALVGNG